ncbi:MAG: diguanylate cyclase [Pseudonocardiales bacterium]|jgi:EAL domain-containing protein (putative c-di-GMP-specific phosphodiesterase class I)|nr:diguanylate cyclase [Pseudonocardiales bacterium]
MTSLQGDTGFHLGADISTELDRAVRGGELRLVYQPEVHLRTRTVVAVEALLRWQHPSRGLLEPSGFIAVAEQSSAINEVGAWVIDEGVRELASWLTALPDLSVTLRVNVSPLQLAQDAIVSVFADALERHGVSGQCVCAEITERVPRDLARLAATLPRLRALGIRSAIDDFGLGYSGLSQLRALPVDLIKIDRSLVAGIAADERARTILRAMVDLAGDLGIAVTAEGVESEPDARALDKLGCEYAQGHLLGAPVPGADILELLRARGARTSA